MVTTDSPNNPDNPNNPHNLNNPHDYDGVGSGSDSFSRACEKVVMVVGTGLHDPTYFNRIITVNRLIRNYYS